MNTCEIDFAARLRGTFRGVLQWTDLDALWAAVRSTPTGWYAVIAGEAAPTEPLGDDALRRLVDQLDALLRREHHYDYCGIVYADDPARPTLIKVFDPNHLGCACGGNKTPTPPRWLLSRHRPTAIDDAAPLPGNRRRWWEQVLGR